MKIYLFLGIMGAAYVTANKDFYACGPDKEFNDVGEAINYVCDSELFLQLDRKLLDKNKGAGGFSFAGDDYDIFTADL